MMELVAFDLPGGGSAIVQSRVPDEDRGAVRIAREDGLIVRSGRRFDEAVAVVRPVAETLLAQLQGLARAPDELRVEFGIVLDVKAGAVVTSSGVQANFMISLVWRSKS
jgi:hypothetical protein